MILPDFKLKSRINLNLNFSGMDSPSNAKDKSYFENYRYKINYKFNSRGFRDEEWPDNLNDVIWCLGDSFTVGLGCPANHTWHYVLSQKTKKRCINVSMDGASNDWIARKALSLFQEIKPKIVVIHWSFLWRSELPDNSLPDEDRRQQFLPTENFSAMLERFASLVKLVEAKKENTVVIHSTIPGFCDYTVGGLEHIWDTAKGPSWPDKAITNIEDYKNLPDFVKEELKEFFNLSLDGFNLFNKVYKNLCNEYTWIAPFVKSDLARDGFHYDIVTANKFANQILELI